MLPAPDLKSHNNSQHVLAICGHHPNVDAILDRFDKTSALPCAVWRSSSVVLASNYPDCIVECRQFVVLCAGFAYHYSTAFFLGGYIKTTFAQTILEYCEQEASSSQDHDILSDLANRIGRCLKRVSGHFSVYLVHKESQQLWAWNDPFGLLPVHYCYNDRNGSIVLSSHWDCLVPALDGTPELDWDVVAEYLTFGTTLGGINDNNNYLRDRTFIRKIYNLSPGTSVHLETSSEDQGCPEPHLSRYIQCYGACEELRLSDETNETNSDDAPSPERQLNIPPRRRRNFFRGIPSSPNIPGIRLAEKSSPPPPPKESSSLLGQALWKKLFHCVSQCVQQALQPDFVTRAALTGGGDTRLILASLLMLQQQLTPIVFQTHSKQKTDWQIVRHLARLFQLPHERIQATSTTVEGYSRLAFWNRQEAILSNLHDQTPLRRRQRRRRDRCKEHVVAYTIHGRFGTEFLGCLCFDKSPLDLRTREEVDGFRPKATRWFQAIFGDSTAIRNPMDSLTHCFHKLEQDKEKFEALVSDKLRRTLKFDVAYAFQLQLFTRAGLSDIYKGLRGGSWFSIPSAQFTRNAITPFLDNQLLQLMMCCVSTQDKEEPYQLYGRFYQAVVPDALLKVPSNNTLLCLHTGIPRALKAPEATPRPFQPKLLKKSNKASSLEAQFHPIFWKGAKAIYQTAPVKMDANVIAKDPRPEVQALVELVGGGEDVCLLSGRLQSFLLWYERRFLPHLTMHA